MSQDRDASRQNTLDAMDAFLEKRVGATQGDTSDASQSAFLELSEPRILVVEDSSTMRDIIVDQLKEVGYYDVDVAGDGLRALEALELGNIDLVMTDWNMPNMDGLTFLRSVRSQARFEKLPILVTTSRNAREDVLVALKEGATDFIVKPFGPVTLSEKIAKALQSTETDK